MIDRKSKLTIFLLIGIFEASSGTARSLPPNLTVTSVPEERITTQLRRESWPFRPLDDAPITVGDKVFSIAYFGRTTFIGNTTCDPTQAATYEVEYVSACMNHSSTESFHRKFDVQNGCSNFIEEYYSTRDCTGEVLTTSPVLATSLMTQTDFDICEITSIGSSVDTCTVDSNSVVNAGQYFLENTYEDGCGSNPNPSFTSTYYRANYCLVDGASATQWVRNESNYMVEESYSDSCENSASTVAVSVLDTCVANATSNQQSEFTYSSGSGSVLVNMALSFALIVGSCTVLM